MNGSPARAGHGPAHSAATVLLPNYELDVERSALGAPLVIPEVLPVMEATGLQPRHFYRREHQAIYAAELALLHRGQSTPISLVRVELEAQGVTQLDGRSIESYLTFLTTECRDAVAGPSYAQTVMGSWYRRRAMDASRLWYKLGSGKGDPKRTISSLLRAQQTIFGPAVAPPLSESQWGDVISGQALQAYDVPPLVEWLPGLFTEGFVLLVGAPKVGKSYLIMHLFRSLATGSLALGSLQCLPCRVLLCSLEDGKNRTARRWQAMNAALAEQDGAPPVPDGMDFKFALPPLDTGGLDFLAEYLARYAGPPGSERRVLIGIDTLIRVRPDEREAARSASIYERDHKFISLLTDLTRRYACCLVTSHHDRKAQSTDMLDASSGSKGLPAAADTIIYVKSPPNEVADVVTLDVRGRDLEGGSYRVTRDVAHATWTISEASTPGPGERKLTPRQEDTLRIALRLSAGGATFKASEVAGKLLGGTRNNAANLLAELVTAGLVTRLGSNRDSRWALSPAGWEWFGAVPHGEASPDTVTDGDGGDDEGLF